MNLFILEVTIKEYKRIQKEDKDFYELYLELETETESKVNSNLNNSDSIISDNKNRTLIKGIFYTKKLQKALGLEENDLKNSLPLINRKAIIEGSTEVSSIQLTYYRKKVWTIYISNMTLLNLPIVQRYTDEINKNNNEINNNNSDSDNIIKFKKISEINQKEVSLEKIGDMDEIQW